MQQAQRHEGLNCWLQAVANTLQENVGEMQDVGRRLQLNARRFASAERTLPV